MEERLETTIKSSTIKKVYQKQVPAKSIRKQIRNSRRRLRKKRSKVKYYKKRRHQRQTADLCSAVEVFDITDMDWTPVKCSSSNLPTDVVEWHKQEQIAYWKSKAVSLELENRMLKQHLRNVYAQTLVDYSNTSNTVNEISHETVETTSRKQKDKKNKTNTTEVVPNLPDSKVKDRLKEMREIYGDKAEKLMGMETALQLDYERHLEQSKPIFWPSLPLKL